MYKEFIIPNELWIEVFKLLPIKDRLCLAKTCGFFNAMSRGEIIWRDDYKNLKLTAQPQQDIKSLFLNHIRKVPIIFPVYEHLVSKADDPKMWSLLNGDFTRKMHLSVDDLIKSDPERIKGFYKCFIRGTVLLRAERYKDNYLWRKEIKREMIYSYISRDKNVEIKNPTYKHFLDDVLPTSQTLSACLGNGFSP